MKCPKCGNEDYADCDVMDRFGDKLADYQPFAETLTIQVPAGADERAIKQAIGEAVMAAAPGLEHFFRRGVSCECGWHVVFNQLKLELRTDLRGVMRDRQMRVEEAFPAHLATGSF